MDNIKGDTNIQKGKKKPSERIKTSLYIDKDLLSELKIYAIKKDTKVNDIIINSIKELLDQWRPGYQKVK